MKTTLLRFVLSLCIISSLASCTTAYDAYGNPRQVVTPEGAILGAAAVGLLAYGLSESNHHHDRNRYDHRRYPRYRRSHYHR
ncbi:MAG: hypothetical protein OJI67_19245 [Prosthecobacter sp.]|nr:hypothetical protein [Prosthecobacter sp.]